MMTNYKFAVYSGLDTDTDTLQSKMSIKNFVGYAKTYEEAFILFEKTDIGEKNKWVNLLCLTTFIIVHSSVTYNFNNNKYNDNKYNGYEYCN